ncbi:MAG: hypothetical protein JWN20_481 [Jatrophihabitantaceae bacterium]|nr:hypothetical protein [Jatrophihabitantaceae bacterium]
MLDDGSPEGGAPSGPASPIATELEALIDLGAQWLRSVLPDDHIATGAPECAGCPLCRLIRAVRSEESELAATVAAGVDSAVTAVNAILMLLRAHGAPADAGSSEPGASDAQGEWA